MLLNRKWSVFTHWKTWLFIPFLLLFISPVLYAYYLQFDLHPEKVVRNMSNISGVKFILWDQNFERFGGRDLLKEAGIVVYSFFTILFSGHSFPGALQRMWLCFLAEENDCL